MPSLTVVILTVLAMSVGLVSEKCLSYQSVPKFGRWGPEAFSDRGCGGFHRTFPEVQKQCKPTWRKKNARCNLDHLGYEPVGSLVSSSTKPHKRPGLIPTSHDYYRRGITLYEEKDCQGKHPGTRSPSLTVVLCMLNGTVPAYHLKEWTLIQGDPRVPRWLSRSALVQRELEQA
ncbi:hypothetical protein BV22DRAFT_166654 [Leucogyrophana mollusca]|uniref:Uncharacterized protein n=1 Tax=Leucogyrophana mollusca TaxID=85980 RepID=A0ACB8BTS7_9AGAM|nr:hypothetical protein BV22DRAFT_166654 [Leucogyrophana mollusca]